MLTLDVFIIALLVVFVAQVVKGTVGFGGALAAMPGLTLLYGPADAIFLSALVDVASGIILVPSIWRRLRWQLMLLLFLPMVGGQYLAAGVVPMIPVDTFKLVLGLLVLVLGADFAIRPVRPNRGELVDLPDDDGRPLLWGGVGGFGAGLTSGLFGTPGPPVVVYFKHFFCDQFTRAHLIALFLPGAAALVVIMTLKGTVSNPEQLLWTGLGLAPAVLVGSLSGAWLSPRLSRKSFARFVGVVLAVAGASLVIMGL